MSGPAPGVKGTHKNIKIAQPGTQADAGKLAEALRGKVLGRRRLVWSFGMIPVAPSRPSVFRALFASAIGGLFVALSIYHMRCGSFRMRGRVTDVTAGPPPESTTITSTQSRGTTVTMSVRKLTSSCREEVLSTLSDRSSN